MFLLSKEDILNELGKNLFIFPLMLQNIQDASLDLTISKFSWSLKNKKTAFEEDKNAIVIEAHDVVYAYTCEAIYVTNRIAGIYTSLVSNCKIGINPISTNLDPNYVDFSLIVLHNISDDAIVLNVGHPIASVQFFYLHTPTHIKESVIAPNHDALLRETFPGDIQVQLFFEHCQTNRWSKNRREMITQYQNPDLRKSIKQYTRIQKKSFSLKYRIFTSKIVRYFLLLIISICVYLIIHYFSSKANINSSEIITALVTVIFTIIATDVFKEIN